MKTLAFFKPRWLPLLGWGVLAAAGLLAAYVLSQRADLLFVGGEPPAAPAGEGDTIDQAARHLEEIVQAMARRRGDAPDDGRLAIDPAPEAPPPPPAAAELAAIDPLLKGAVVVRSGNRLYLMLGDQRFRVGERIGTGETVHRLDLQWVDLTLPDGRKRRVELGRGLGGPPREPSAAP